MQTTTEHYRLLLGLDDSWDVVRVNLSLEKKKVEIVLEYVASGGTCPECGGGGPLADHAAERKWRHLDTMQFETILIAKTPRTRCPQCGIKTITVPWAEKHSRFTVMFEALAIEMIKACGNVKAVAVDMWPAYLNSIRSNVPQAAIVHDRFHVSKYLNEAVDKVRRQEHKKLKKEKVESPLTGSKQLWLFNPENFNESQSLRFSDLKGLELKTSRAWGIKEHFRWFWSYTYTKNAEKFFRKWYGWAARSRLKPIVSVAKTLNRHLGNLLTYFRHRITNAKSEGFNSRIQSIKSNARGFRSFENYRTRILFYCGKLKLLPDGISH